MQFGKLWANDTVYALYTENAEKAYSMPIVSQNSSIPLPDNPETAGQDFKDIIFSTPSSEQVIFITARVLASRESFYLKYYYNIHFLPLDDEINIEAAPYMMEYFRNDVVKYDVFNGGKINYEGMQQMAIHWRNKKQVLPNSMLASGTSKNYNTSPHYIQDTTTATIPIFVRQNQVFYKDSLIATYRRETAMSFMPHSGSYKNDYLYYINSTDKNLQATLRIHTLRAAFYLETADKHFFEIVSPYREEDKIIAAATKVLLARLQNMQTK